MKIIYFLSNITYPPLEGAHEQTLNVIKEISLHSNSVELFVFVKKLSEFDMDLFFKDNPNIKVIKVIEDSNSYSFRLFFYFLILLVNRKIFFNIFDIKNFDFLKSYDVIHLEGIPLLPFALFLNKKNIVFSPIDAWSLRQKRLLKNESNIIKKFFRFLNYKLSYCIEYKNFNKLNSIHFVSKDDVKYYNNFKLNNIINIPVALPDFYFSRNIELDNSKTILLIGDIRVNYIYEGIYLFFKNNYPEVQKNFSQIKFIVVSKSIPFGKLKDLTINNKNISFLPWVDDLYDLCCKSTAIVLNDLNGTGQKNRTIMSLASGRPVLGTNFAFQGIEINNAEHGYIYKIDNELNVSLMKVLNDPILADKIGIAGKKYAYTNFSMHSVSKQWLSLYSNIAKREVYAVSRSL